MKKLIMSIAFLLSGTALHATIFDIDPTILMKNPVTYDESGIGFALQNKSARPIWVSLSAESGLIQVHEVPVATFKESTELQLRHNINQQPTKLAVWYSKPTDVTYGKKTPWGERVFTPKPNKLYSFKPGKTIYLTWDQANYARPQTGFLKGVLKKTDSNLSLERNVSQDDISEQA